MNRDIICCLVYLDSLVIGIEITRVEEVLLDLPVTRVPRSHRMIEGLINLRGQILTSIDLFRAIFSRSTPIRKNETHIVVNSASGMYSLLVQNAGEVVTIPASQLEPPIATIHPELRSRIDCVAQTEWGIVHLLNVDSILEGTLPYLDNDKAAIEERIYHE